MGKSWNQRDVFVFFPQDGAFIQKTQRDTTCENNPDLLKLVAFKCFSLRPQFTLDKIWMAQVLHLKQRVDRDKFCKSLNGLVAFAWVGGSVLQLFQIKLSAFVHYRQRDGEVVSAHRKKDKIRLELRSEHPNGRLHFEMFTNTKGQTAQNIQRQNTGRDLNSRMVCCTRRTAKANIYKTGFS